MPPVHAVEPPVQDLASSLELAVKRFADKPLFGTKQGGAWRWMTYADFGRLVDRYRAGLAALGLLARGERVGVISANRVEWAACAYAAYGLGLAVVPMYESQRDGDWELILGDSDARVCFVSSPEIAARVSALRERLPGLRRVICFDAPAADPDSLAAFLAAGEAAPAPVLKPEPGDVASLIYTSGTSGRPKGVLLSQRCIVTQIHSIVRRIPVLHDDRTLAFLPWAHVFGHVCDLHFMIAHGVAIGLCEGADKIVANLGEVRPTFLLAVPRVFHRVHAGVMKNLEGKPAPVRRLVEAALRAHRRRRAGEPLGVVDRLAMKLADALVFAKVRERFGGRLRGAICGGSALSPEVAEFIDALGITLLEGYGLTESCSVVSVNGPSELRLGSVGRPLDGVSVRLEPAEGGGPGEGEILVRGHNVMLGYHGLPEENARTFTEDGYMRTGDLGRADADGYLYITGRVKELYKLENGRYIAPAPIEERLALSPFVAHAVVTGMNRPYNVAIIEVDPAALRGWAKERALDAEDPAALVERQEVRALLRAEIERRLADVRPYERVLGFVLTAEAFTQANGLLTPKLSVRRREVERRYADAIEALYREAAG